MTTLAEADCYTAAVEKAVETVLDEKEGRERITLRLANRLFVVTRESGELVVTVTMPSGDTVPVGERTHIQSVSTIADDHPEEALVLWAIEHL